MNKLGKLEKVNLRDIWPNEKYDFSVWLSKEENLKELSNTIGIDIVLEGRESAVGKYSVDIYGKEEGTDRKVVIENQLITRRPRFLNSIQTNNKSSLNNKQISSKNYSQLSPKVL